MPGEILVWAAGTERVNRSADRCFQQAFTISCSRMAVSSAKPMMCSQSWRL